jgi:hypothetical protein
VPALVNHVRAILAHKDTDPVVTAMHLEHCCNETGLSIRQLAHLAGADLRSLGRCARLASLPPEARSLVRSGHLDLAAADVLAARVRARGLDAQQANDWARRAAEMRWTAAQCRKNLR